ncbi:MAG: hypothetical protein KH135_00665 [Firmicutes bacterium]|nr:hypothetical protein [Bacillota bacterium]
MMNFKEKMLFELIELVKKTTKIEVRLSQKSEDMTKREIEILEKQYGIMCQYVDVLKERINYYLNQEMIEVNK